jgi:hypothetical protein
MPNVGMQEQLANFHAALDKYDTSAEKKTWLAIGS